MVRIAVFAMTAFLCGDWFGAAVPAGAQVSVSTEAQVYELNFSKGVAAFNQARYAEARTFFSQALDAKPDDPDARYYLGQTLLRTKQYSDAEREFRALLDRGVAMPRAWLGLGMALYYQGRYEETVAALESAQSALPNDPLVYFFQGLAHNRLGNYDRSPALLTKAMLLSPDLAPEGHYHRGLAHYAQGVFDEARVEFEAAIAAEPNSAVAESARQYLRQLAGRPGAAPARAEEPAPQRRWDLTASASLQYDTNVVLLPLGTQPPGGPTGISRRDDVRWVFSGRGEYRLLQDEHWTVGAGYGVYQSLHHTLNGFDVQDHSPALYVQHRFDRVQTRLDYMFDYVTVGRDPFLTSHALRPIVTVREADRFFTQVQAGYQNKDFHNDRFPLNSTRDAKNWLFGVMQFVHFPNSGAIVRAGYTFDTDRTGGGSPTVAVAPSNADWAYTGHRFSIGAVLPTFKTLKPDLSMDYYRQNYDNPNSFSPGGRTVRQDNIVIISAGVSRELTSKLSVSAQYSYTRDSSNVALFDYERSIMSLSLIGSF